MIKANELSFDDIYIGQKESFSTKITELMLNEFSNFSGDFNPLHVDDEYASKTPFGKRVCHGMLLASFFSRLIGMYMPGKNALYFSQTLNFRAPCFIGDTVTIIGEIIDKSPSTKIITIKTTIHNQIDKYLIDGIAKVIVRENTSK